MTEEGFKRKLTAILSADVEGYSRLMGEDEDATIRILTSYRELMSTLIRKHRGRVVDSPGDNLLAEFLSVVDAVRCAVEIQEELRVRNAELPENRRMEFRIGINLGDVVEEGERIYGDGVNITARVEGLAEGGGICISGTVYDSIKNKLSLSYESLGEHTVKNITEPVRVYRMRVGPEVREEKAGPRRWQKAALAAVVVLLVAAGIWAIWNFYFRPPQIEPASVEKMAFPLPDKPSIAVLPFDNLSGDSDQEYIADGITENIITALSKISEIFVIASNSTFTYKGKPVKIQQVSEALGVRYVLEGSVQIADERIRITAQLIDATGGHHLWAERYDRALKDLFALQDEITMKILTALAVKLTHKAQARGFETENLESWGYTLRGAKYIHRFTKEANAEARQMFEKAIELDPEYASAHSLLGWTHLLEWMLGWSHDPQSLERAFELAQTALSLDNSLPEAHRLLGNIYLSKKQHEQAIVVCEKAIALNPNYADGFAALGEILNWVGRSEEALELLKRAMRLNPGYPPWYIWNLGHAYFLTGRFEMAISALRRLLERNPNWPILVRGYLVASYDELILEKEARAAAAEVLRINPKFSLEHFSKILRYKNQADREHLINAVRKAGLK